LSHIGFSAALLKSVHGCFGIEIEQKSNIRMVSQSLGVRNIINTLTLGTKVKGF